jgi:putative SOS response-associated peptidase YedK
VLITMCGRFALSLPAKNLADLFSLDEVPELTPRYNIAPTQPVCAILIDRVKEKRIAKMLSWGLIPSWSKDPTNGPRLINARSETVDEKPAFRGAFKNKRCLLPADGYFEWRQIEGKREPFFFRLKSGEPCTFAGLWEHWEGHSGEVFESCTILTTQANEVAQKVHDRMPVILPRRHYDLWLDPIVTEKDILKPFLVPYPSDEIEFYPISSLVNNPKNDMPECIAPLKETP